MFIPAVHIEDWRLVAWWCSAPSEQSRSPNQARARPLVERAGPIGRRIGLEFGPVDPGRACVGRVCVSEQAPPLFCPTNHFTPISTSCTSLFSQGRTMIMASHPRVGHTLPSVIGRHLHCSLVAALPNTPSASPASLARKYHDPKWSSSDLQLKPCAKSVVCPSP